MEDRTYLVESLEGDAYVIASNMVDALKIWRKDVEKEMLAWRSSSDHDPEDDDPDWLPPDEPDSITRVKTKVLVTTR